MEVFLVLFPGNFSRKNYFLHILDSLSVRVTMINIIVNVEAAFCVATHYINTKKSG
jgi:hypothetical protein